MKIRSSQSPFIERYLGLYRSGLMAAETRPLWDIPLGLRAAVQILGSWPDGGGGPGGVQGEDNQLPFQMAALAPQWEVGRRKALKQHSLKSIPTLKKIIGKHDAFPQGKY